MRRRSRAGSEPVKARHRKTVTPKRPDTPMVRGRSAPAPDQETAVARLTRERDEALERQAATAEVLKIISASPTELQPVLEIVVKSAARFCEADDVTIFELDGQDLRIAAHSGAVPQDIGVRFRCSRGSVAGRTVLERRPVHVIDLQAEAEEFPVGSAFAKRLGVRTQAGVPLLREGVAVGTIQLRRTEVHPFTDRQISLLETFADQAVIAIENARLLNELRQRTADLSESLEQQTATSEVLKVISSSPGDLQPVFQAMLENATRICDAVFGNIYRREGDGLHLVASHNTPAAFVEHRQGSPYRPSSTTPMGRAIASKTAVHVLDAAVEPAYIEERDPGMVEGVELGNIRTFIAVPLLKETELIGVLTVFRQEVRPFSDKQIALLQNFAAQAVIAIENTRLLNELRESLDRQTAAADVLRVISSSPGELEPVFKAILENATRICEANFGQLQLYENGAFRIGAMHNVPPAWAKMRQHEPVFRPGPLTPLAQIVATKQLVHVADYNEHPAYQQGDPGAVRFVEVAGVRTLVLVPMLKEEELIGTIQVYRQEVRPFTDKQLQLLENFAAQAVIAIENTRLLSELRQSLQQQTATADVLKLITRSTFNLQTVLDTLIESAASLCQADQGYIGRPKDDGLFRAEASYGYSPALKDLVDRTPWKAGRESAIGRVLLERAPIHIVDVETDPEYRMVEMQKTGGYHSVLGVPLLREGTLIGVLVLACCSIRPFTDKQIKLVTAFADQAVIAIENVRLFEEIQDNSRQLEEASQHKSQFLANMSHELRTPLNAILGYSELMADGAYGEPSEKMLGILKRLEANGKHLLGLINDVLDLSKIEAGQLVLELSDYSVQDIAQTVRSTLESLAADKKLAFKLDVSSGLPPGRGDGRRLTQVLINLVGNAIKFTDAGEVAIKAEANNGAFHVSVRDTGPGISAADQAKLFQEFQQADNAITKKKGGTGLGLAISKRIIEMHGGKIWVESQPGQGSTFAFKLPVIVERQAEPAT
jgi:signal transduction histidine kinase